MMRKRPNEQLNQDRGFSLCMQLCFLGISSMLIINDETSFTFPEIVVATTKRANLALPLWFRILTRSGDCFYWRFHGREFLFEHAFRHVIFVFDALHTCKRFRQYRFYSSPDSRQGSIFTHISLCIFGLADVMQYLRIVNEEILQFNFQVIGYRSVWIQLRCKLVHVDDLIASFLLSFP